LFVPDIILMGGGNGSVANGIEPRSQGLSTQRSLAPNVQISPQGTRK